MAEEQPRYKLIYFNARGRAEHIRYIFAYAGIDYVDERITNDRWPELKKCEYGKAPRAGSIIPDSSYIPFLRSGLRKEPSCPPLPTSPSSRVTGFQRNEKLLREQLFSIQTVDCYLIHADVTGEYWLSGLVTRVTKVTVVREIRSRVNSVFSCARQLGKNSRTRRLL